MQVTNRLAGTGIYFMFKIFELTENCFGVLEVREKIFSRQAITGKDPLLD